MKILPTMTHKLKVIKLTVSEGLKAQFPILVQCVKDMKRLKEFALVREGTIISRVLIEKILSN
jgi:hypothetical protein